jgi:hypothetical protein
MFDSIFNCKSYKYQKNRCSIRQSVPDRQNGESMVGPDFGLGWFSVGSRRPPCFGPFPFTNFRDLSVGGLEAIRKQKRRQPLARFAERNPGTHLAFDGD